MLERVPSSAECAAHIFLRRLEAPIRSQRILGPAFWKHGGEDIEAPAWWPMYLEDIRSRNYISYGNSNPNAAATTCPVVPRYSFSAHTTNRTFSNAAPHQRPHVAPLALEEDTEQRELKQERVSHFKHDTIRATRPKTIDQLEEKRKRRVTNTKEEEDKLEATWTNFVTSGFNRLQASQLLHALAARDTDRDLYRAIRVFDLIPKYKRSARDYQIVVDVSIRLRRYSFAIQTIQEAVARGLDHETFCKFLAVCVSRDLWDTAATLWRDPGEWQAQTILDDPREVTTNNRSIAGEYISCFDAVSDFPSKLVSLMTRLQNDDPALQESRKDLIDLCKALALVVVESTKAMDAITDQGILAVLAMEQQLGFNSDLHFAALATIGRMREKGTKCHIASLIYENFKSIHADVFLPKWVLGTMLAIYTAGRQSPLALRSILSDYRRTYTRPEDNMFLRVMKACANLGEFNHVQAVLDEFCRNYKPRGPGFLNPLIHAHAVLGAYREAQSQFDSIQSTFGFKQSPKNWNSLLLAYSRCAQPRKVYEKFREMQLSDATPDQYSWSILVSTAAREGDTEYACKLVTQAAAAGIPTPLAMTGAIVDSYLLNDQPDDALALVIQASGSRESGDQSAIRLWNSLFRYYAFKSDGDAISRTQEKMKEFGIQADGMTYAALMTALVIQGRTQDAVQILRTLHFSQTISVSEFHYSILIYGLAKEKRRDLASVIHREMQEKFGRTSLSAKLAMLHLEASHIEETALSGHLPGKPHLKPDFQPIMDTLDDVLENLEPGDLASPVPNPGFQRRSARNSLQDIFVGSLINFLNRNQAHESSKKIIDMLEESKPLSTPSQSTASRSWQDSVERLSRQLEASVASQDWSLVDRKWEELVDIVLHNCVSAETQAHRPVQQLSDSDGLSKAGNLGDKEPEFLSMIPTSSTTSIKALPAHRFAISRPLAQYIRALSEQQRHPEMINTIDSMRDHGFSLSGKNWNGFIQALCRSPNADYQTLAFELFEKHLLPNSPSFDVIRRGMWVEPSKERPRRKLGVINHKKDDRKSRDVLEKLDPSLLIPSYYTVVHLASVWLKASRKEYRGDQSLIQRLRLQTPETVKLVLQTPYLRDKVQGVLLRGTQATGDLFKRPRQPQTTFDLSGVQGSQLLIDHLPANLLDDIKVIAAKSDGHSRGQQLRLAEKILGEIDRSRISVPSKGRLESLDERDRRVDRTESYYLLTLDQMAQQIRQDSQEHRPLVGTMARGASSLNLSALPVLKQYQTTRRSGGQHSMLSADVRRVLKKVAETVIDPPALKAKLQMPPLRTTTLTQRRRVILHASSNEQDRAITISRRTPSRRRNLSRTKQSFGLYRKRFRKSRLPFVINTNSNRAAPDPPSVDDIRAHLRRRLQILQEELARTRTQMASHAAPSQTILNRLLNLQQGIKNARKYYKRYSKTYPRSRYHDPSRPIESTSIVQPSKFDGSQKLNSI